MNLIERLGNWQRFHKTRSRALGAAIEALILEGGLPLGTALPAERIFAAQLGVSRTLVISAYATLREAGWLTSRQGSATRIAKLPPGHVAATHKPKTTPNPMSASITVNDAVIDLSIACAVPDAAWLTLPHDGAVMEGYLKFSYPKAGNSKYLLGSTEEYMAIYPDTKQLKNILENPYQLDRAAQIPLGF